MFSSGKRRRKEGVDSAGVSKRSVTTGLHWESVVLSPAAVAWFLSAAIGLLLIAHTLTQVARFGYGRDYLFGLSARMYFGGEANIPAWFSSCLMLVCGLLLLWIAAATRAQGGPRVRQWASLGFVFVGLSADEAAAWHELLSPAFSRPARWLGSTFGGLLSPLERRPGYAWVLPGAVACTFVGLVYLRFLNQLTRRTSYLFVASGVVFVSGALGAELLGGWYASIAGPDTVAFVAILTVEETMEMVGLSLFAWTLLSHIELEFGGLPMRLGRD